MDILNDELQNMRDFGKDVSERCDCALKYTHGLPYACELREAHTVRRNITTDDIHNFWSSLEVTQPGQQSASASGWTDHDYFRWLAEEIEAADLAIVRYLNHLIDSQLHPDQQGYTEPAVKENPRGRPKKKNSTKRNLSRWEYSERGRTAGRKSTSSCASSQSGYTETGRRPGRKSTSSCAPSMWDYRERGRPVGRTSTSSCAPTSSSSQDPTDTFETDFFQYQHRGRIPYVVHSYVQSYLDVTPDGNCGFRVVASYIYRDQQKWDVARRNIANEIAANIHLYAPFYWDGVDVAIDRIRWDGGPCGEEHWMNATGDLFAIVTLFNAVVVLLSYGPNDNNMGMASMTVFPIHAPSTATRPDCEIVIGHLGSYAHFIRVNLCSDSPLPPLCYFWEKYRDVSVEDWPYQYQSRFQLWNDIRTAAGI
ncbi:OTU-like cysteine protease family protein [Striga asiatica]|uniref:OTU-like cysteine protease family protein n=1 Tax=Striga asiatica TaxID=4170 RepID=A0A5A7PE93_STRAF|nr:OTU-like cysteine protease family protein [Striga asiatica]